MEALAKAIDDQEAYGYPGSAGHPQFCEPLPNGANSGSVFAGFGQKVLTLMARKTDWPIGAEHADPGDVAIVPDPGYPVYEAGLALAGVEPYSVPLRDENGFLPIWNGFRRTFAESEIHAAQLPEQSALRRADLLFRTMDRFCDAV